MSDTSSELSFERATYENRDEARPPCGLCQKELGSHYWRWQQRVVCASCRDQLERTLAKSRSGASFAKALLLGGLTALGCGIAYAVFVAISTIQIAFVTIGIAFLVAKVIRKASSGVGGLRFQVLAVVLTYVAGTMGYVPAIFKAISSDAKSHAAQTQSTTPAASKDADGKDGEVEGTPGDRHQPADVGTLLGAIAFLGGLVLASPFLTFTESPIGMLIILFGLWEAWKRSRGVPLSLDGPYNVPPKTAGPVASE